MELRHLRYFVAVAEHGNFGHAAVALHTAQPSLSLQIKQLEEEVGTPLFERTTRRVRLTPAGEVFLIDCRRVLEELAESVESARATANGERGLLRVSYVSGAMGAGALPLIFRDFRESHPDVALDVHPMPAHAQIEELREERLHVGVFSAGYRDDEFEQILMWRERLVLAMPEDHRFATRDIAHFHDLQAERLMLYSRGSGSQLQNAIISVLHDLRVDPTIVHQGADAETIIGLVAAGLGVSLVPSSWEAFQFPGVVYRPIEPLSWIEPGAAMFWKARRDSPLTDAFLMSVRMTLKSNVAIKALKVSIAS